MRATRPLACWALAVVAALAAGTPSSAEEAVKESDEEEGQETQEELPSERVSSFSLFAGFFAGTDSNPARAPLGDQKEDSVAEYVVGLAASSRSPGFGLDLRYQMKGNAYGDQTNLNFVDSRGKLGFYAGSDKVRLTVDVDHSVLGEPVDMEVDSNLEQTVLTWQPKFDMKLGVTEIGIGMEGESFRCGEEEANPYMDCDASSLWAEARWLGGPERTQQVFFHLDSTTFDFVDDEIETPDGKSRDFGRMRWYAGWRSEEPDTSGIEIAFGSDTMAEHERSEVYLSVRYRTVLAGRGAIKGGSYEVAYLRGAEPAATADFAARSRFMLRYVSSPQARMGWSLSLESERAEYSDPYDVTDAQYPSEEHFTVSRELMRNKAEFTIQGDFGSLEGFRLRWYLGARFETRMGTAADCGYDRLRLLGGASFVY